MSAEMQMHRAGRVGLVETLLDEGNYTVNPEANGKHDNPIWILVAVLVVGAEDGRSGGSDAANTVMGERGRISERTSGKNETREGKRDLRWTLNHNECVVPRSLHALSPRSDIMVAGLATGHTRFSNFLS